MITYILVVGKNNNNKPKHGQWLPIQPTNTPKRTTPSPSAPTSGAAAVISPIQIDDDYEHAVLTIDDENSVSNAFGFWNSKQTTAS